MSLSLLPEIRQGLRIFKAISSKGGFWRDVSKAPDLIVDNLRIPKSHFSDVSIDTTFDPEKTLINDILESDINDTILTVGGDHSVSYFSTAAQIIRHGAENTGLIWIDARPDLYTEDSSYTNNRNGMGVAGLMGLTKIWNNRLSRKYRLSPKNIVYIGTRDMDDVEMEILVKNNIKHYMSDEVKHYGSKLITDKVLYEDLAHVNNVHVSFDVNVMDPPVFSCASYQYPHGLNFIETMALMKYLGMDSRVNSLDIVEFNPNFAVNEFRKEMCTNICTDIIKATLRIF